MAKIAAEIASATFPRGFCWTRLAVPNSISSSSEETAVLQSTASRARAKSSVSTARRDVMDGLRREGTKAVDSVASDARAAAAVVMAFISSLEIRETMFLS